MIAHEHFSAFARALLATAILWTLVPGVGSAEQEPNDACQAADDIDASVIPVVVTGELEPREVKGDIDFYRVAATPGAALEIAVTGEGAGAQGVSDTLLASLDGDCETVALNDDHLGLGSRLFIHVPRAGSFALAVSGSGDTGLTGEHPQSGRYRLSLRPFRAIGSISGQLLLAETGMPPVDGSVSLYSCADVADPQSCGQRVTSGSTYAGTYELATKASGAPLPPGSYRVLGRVEGMFAWSDPFIVRDGEHYSLPTLFVEEPPLIGSIQGRIVDARTGAGLSGEGYPFVRVQLLPEPCAECIGLGAVTPDSAGYFRFDPGTAGVIPPGSFSLVVTASDYERTEVGGIASVAEGEHRRLGGIALEPTPVRVAITQPCEDEIVNGGICRYRVRVLNRSEERVRGVLWSLVDATIGGDLYSSTRFQAGEPVRVSLRPGEGMSAYFQTAIPSTLPASSSVCALAFFGDGDEEPYFHPEARAQFCLEKRDSGYAALPKERTRALLGN